MTQFDFRKALIESRYEELIRRVNVPLEGNGVYVRYKNPIITADSVPPTWRYDFNPATNPQIGRAHV